MSYSSYNIKFTGSQCNKASTCINTAVHQSVHYSHLLCLLTVYWLSSLSMNVVSVLYLNLPQVFMSLIHVNEHKPPKNAKEEARDKKMN